MKIQWLGHSCFRLEESTDSSVVTDPYRSYIGIELPKVQSDVVTVSHDHDDHNFVEGVSGNPVVLSETGSFDVKGIHISAIGSSHDEVDGAKRGGNLIFKFRIDGVDVCHMGDIGQECTPDLAEAIGPVNVLLIPVGGNYTVDAEQAKEYVDRLMPDIVIPMHYKTRGVELDIDKVDGFLRQFDDEVVEYAESDTIEISRAQFDGEYTRVVVLELPEEE
ncbi:MAG: MBL fold metallo-hydrolase [Clostridia bacterium]|nr:MBL fold metallo-hydrolase [Clostridia bacterium]